MILEAKSSAKVPGLGAIDFATLGRHRDDYKAEACLLIAPRYPGTTKGEDAAAAKMAVSNRISCWTVPQLADVLEQSARRHISARAVFEICCRAFAPDDVASAVAELLSEPGWDERALYRKVVHALRALEDRLPGTPRQVAHVHVELSSDPEFRTTPEVAVRRAIEDLSGASRGALALRQDTLVLNTSISELAVRLSSMLGEPGDPRRPSTFRTATSE